MLHLPPGRIVKPPVQVKLFFLRVICIFDLQLRGCEDLLNSSCHHSRRVEIGVLLIDYLKLGAVDPALHA